jgi:hypothetical protein
MQPMSESRLVLHRVMHVKHLTNYIPFITNGLHRGINSVTFQRVHLHALDHLKTPEPANLISVRLFKTLQTGVTCVCSSD